MSTATESCVYGPVPSRRLGRSLGVDLVPFKNCSYDCIYCQLGRTTTKTVARKTYIPPQKVLNCVREQLEVSPMPDYITLAGSGEPTLHSDLGEIIEGLKSITNVPVAVVTNSSLLWDAEVRRSLLGADVVLPSLDAGDEVLFELINRPHESLAFSQMVGGLAAFVQEFPGQVWLEVMLLAGINSIESETEKIAELVRRIKPHRLQLNSVFRPGAEPYATCLTHARMQHIASIFPGNIDLICEPIQIDGAASCVCPRNEAAIMALLKRRPCTIGDIATGLDLHQAELLKVIDRLLHENKITATTTKHSIFYATARNQGSDNGATGSTGMRIDG